MRWPRSSVPSSCAPPIGTGCCAPAASPPPTCCAAKKASRTHPTRSCYPAPTKKSPRSCATAPSTASPSSHSVVAPASPVDSIPPAASSASVVSLDLRRFDQLLSLDEVSGVAELGAGVTGPDAERLLGERGFSLGHFPQSFEFATIGGFAATRSSGQDSAGYGRFNDMILGLRMITPVGTLDLGRVAASAAGPGPTPAGDRLRGCLRRHHQGALAGAPGTGDDPLRGVVVPRFRHRGRSPARGHPNRHRAHRGPALRRGRERGQSRHHRVDRGKQGHRRLPGADPVRGHQGTHREQAGRDARVAAGPRRNLAGRGARAGLGARPVRRPVPARLTAGRRRALRNPRDRHRLVEISTR